MKNKILRINASARYEDSISRQRADAVIKEIALATGDVGVTVRDVSQGLPFVGRDWVKLKSKPVSEYSPDDTTVMALSQELIAELKDHQHYIFACPIYNFMIPASLKAWVDLVTLPGRTFKETNEGYDGLLEGKCATLVFSSNRTEVGSDNDYASEYLSSILKFIGVQDISIIGGGNEMSLEKIVENYKSCLA